MEEEFLAKMQLSRSELAFPGRTLVIKMRKAWSCAMADTRVGEMEGAWASAGNPVVPSVAGRARRPAAEAHAAQGWGGKTSEPATHRRLRFV